MDDEFVEKMKTIKKELDGFPDKTFVAQAALSTQKWVQDLRKEGVSDPFEDWSLEFIIERIKQNA